MFDRMQTRYTSPGGEVDLEGLSSPVVHDRGTVDHVGVSATRDHDVFDGWRVELSGDVKPEVLLVQLHGRFEDVVEIIGEVSSVCFGDVTKTLEVFFDAEETVHVLPVVAAGEVGESVPENACGVT